MGADEGGVDRGSLFVGRERELAELKAGLADAHAGRGRLFLLSGEPGIGKSRLAEEFSADARSQGATVVWGRCWEAEGAPPYLPWIQILRTMVRRADVPAMAARVGTGAAYIATLVPELRDLAPGIADAPEVSGDDARFAIADSVTELLIRAAEEAPLIVVLDDLHAADRGSLLLLRYATHGLAGSRILILGAYREVEARFGPGTEEQIRELAREAVRLPLRGLDEAAVGGLAARIAGRVVPPRLVSAVHRHTEGNPLFVDEVIRLLIAEGRLTGESLRMPDAVKGTISRRLTRLSDETIGALQAASVVGRDFDVALLADVMQQSLDWLRERLSEAAQAGIIGQASAFRRAGFAHVLFRDSLYDAIPESRRAGLHARVAEALERLAGDDPDAFLSELAYHWSAAVPATHDVERATILATRAGDRAMSMHAYAEALAHYDRALAVVDQGGSRDERLAELLILRGEALWRGGELAPAREAFLRGADIARGTGSAHLVARAALGVASGVAPIAIHEIDETGSMLLREADALLAAEESPLRVQVLSRLAMENLWWEDISTRDEITKRAISIAERLGDPHIVLRALFARCIGMWGPDVTEERFELTRRILDTAQETGDDEMAYLGHQILHRTYWRLGDVARALEELVALRRLAEVLRIRLYREQVAVLELMGPLYFEADLDGTERGLNEILQVEPPLSEATISQLGVGRIWLSINRGDFNEVVAGLHAMFTRFPWLRPVIGSGIGWFLAEAGREDEARIEYEATVAEFEDIPHTDIWAFAIHLIALGCARLSDTRNAPKIYDVLAPYAEMLTFIGMATNLGSIHHPLGCLAATMKRWEQAVSHFEAAYRKNIVANKPMAAATLRDHARALLGRGLPEDAGQALLLADRALAMMREIGMRGWIDSTEAVAEQARSRARTTDAELRKEGDAWSLEFAGSRHLLKPMKGIEYLAQLVKSPYQEWHVLDLVAAGTAVELDRSLTRAHLAELGLRPTRLADAAPLLDAAAKAAYKARLTALDAEREDAHESGSQEQLARVEAEIDAVAGELAAAVGLGGRDRKVSAEAERARVNVARSVKAAIGHIADRCPAAGRHLAASVRTGWFCSYAPDPSDRVTWAL